MRFTVHHPFDGDLHAEFGRDESGFFLEVFLYGETEPTIRFCNAEGSWEPSPPIVWQVLDVLVTLWFVTVAEVAEVRELNKAGVDLEKLGPRLKSVARMLRDLEEVLDA